MTGNISTAIFINNCPPPNNKKKTLKILFPTKADDSAILTNVFFGQLCPSIALQEEDGFVFEIKGWDQ